MALVSTATLNYQRQHRISLLILLLLLLFILLRQFDLDLFDDSLSAHGLAYYPFLSPRNYFRREMLKICLWFLHWRSIIFNDRSTFIHAALRAYRNNIIFSIRPLKWLKRLDLILLENGSSGLHVGLDWSIQLCFIFSFLLFLQYICYHILFEKLVSRSIAIQQVLFLLWRKKTGLLQAGFVKLDVFEGSYLCISEELWVFPVGEVYFLEVGGSYFL